VKLDATLSVDLPKAGLFFSREESTKDSKSGVETTHGYSKWLMLIVILIVLSVAYDTLRQKKENEKKNQVKKQEMIMEDNKKMNHC